MTVTMSEFFEKMNSTMPADADRKQLEEAVSMWREVRAKRLELGRLTQSMQDFETGFKSWIIEVMRQQEQEGVVRDGRITSLSKKLMATVEDKEALLNHIKQTGELDLLQFRLSTSAVDERKENGVDVPGTTYIDVYDLGDKKA